MRSLKITDSALCTLILGISLFITTDCLAGKFGGAGGGFHSNIGNGARPYGNDAYHNNGNYDNVYHHNNGYYDYNGETIGVGNYTPGNGWVAPVIINNSTCTTTQECTPNGTCFQTQQCN